MICTKGKAKNPKFQFDTGNWEYVEANKIKLNTVDVIRSILISELQ